MYVTKLYFFSLFHKIIKYNQLVLMSDSYRKFSNKHRPLSITTLENIVKFGLKSRNQSDNPELKEMKTSSCNKHCSIS